MPLKDGRTQACAACKYRMRRCTPDCQLAPYFPRDDPKTFQNANKLFGVNNMLKILKQVDPSKKMMAMRSIIFEANARDNDPVHGCLGIIQQLYYQLHLAQQELQSVYSQLNFYRQNSSPKIPNNTNTNTNNNSITVTNESTLMSPRSSSGHGLPFLQDNNNNTINSSDEFQYMGSNVGYTAINSSNNNNNNNRNDNCYVNFSKENNKVMWVQQQQQSFNDGSSSQFVSNLKVHEEKEQEEIEEGGVVGHAPIF